MKLLDTGQVFQRETKCDTDRSWLILTNLLQINKSNQITKLTKMSVALTAKEKEVTATMNNFAELRCQMDNQQQTDSQSLTWVMDREEVGISAEFVMDWKHLGRP
jgi:hypothetical protein